jgi:excisionase family DNA binding protein
MQSTPLALSIREACAAANVGRTTLYAAIKDGNLAARKIGRRSIVLTDDLARWLRSLPAIAPSGGADGNAASKSAGNMSNAAKR